jgi:hypothetical protein
VVGSSETSERIVVGFLIPIVWTRGSSDMMSIIGAIIDRPFTNISTRCVVQLSKKCVVHHSSIAARTVGTTFYPSHYQATKTVHVSTHPPHCKSCYSHSHSHSFIFHLLLNHFILVGTSSIHYGLHHMIIRIKNIIPATIVSAKVYIFRNNVMTL